MMVVIAFLLSACLESQRKHVLDVPSCSAGGQVNIRFFFLHHLGFLRVVCLGGFVTATCVSCLQALPGGAGVLMGALPHS